jgi:hypothetical protein
VPTSCLHLFDERLVGIAADEYLLIFAQIMPLPVDIPVSDRRLLFLGGFLHSLQKFITGSRQDHFVFFLLLLGFLFLLLLFELVLLPLFDLISIFLGLILPQLLFLQL